MGSNDQLGTLLRTLSGNRDSVVRVVELMGVPNPFKSPIPNRQESLMKADFIAPVDNRAMTAFTRLLLPAVLNSERLAVKPTPNFINLIRRLNGRNAVIMFNHSDRCDPIVAFALTKDCHQDFWYLAARELFDQEFGLRGLILQNCGAYSVVRGDPPDAASASATVSQIVEGKRKLVEFPEGDVSGRDDQILPLKEDGLHNLFAAQAQLGNEPLFVVPAAIYYQIAEYSWELTDCIERLERDLGLVLDNPGVEARITRLIATVLEHLERRYGLDVRNTEPFHRRIGRICHHLISAVAAFAGLPALQQSHPNLSGMLYTVRGQLRNKYKDHDRNCACKYCRQLGTTARKIPALCVKELDRAQQLLILQSTLEVRPITPEIIWRILDRLEYEITGKFTPKAQRIAWVHATEWVELSEYLPDYENTPEQTVITVAYLVRLAMESALKQVKSGYPKGEEALLVPKE